MTWPVECHVLFRHGLVLPQLISQALLFLNLFRENSAFVLKTDHISMLLAHLSLIVTMATLQLSEMLLGCTELVRQVLDALLVFAVLVQLVEARLLLALDFRKHSIFALQVIQNLSLVLLFVL